MLKKNWYLFTPLILVIVPALIWGYYVSAFGYSPKEGLEALRYFLQSGTRYSQKYANDRFDRVQPGLDGRQVFELIGVPFERHDDDAVWVYSGPRDLTAPYYHERKVLFAKDGKGVLRVKGVVKEFRAPAAGK
ncbi:MAG TPA: hypothetical protein VD994_01525 [Prosthecobacter sp.]|nr:hypothetical protein [Prosthecobacter sp.]